MANFGFLVCLLVSSLICLGNSAPANPCTSCSPIQISSHTCVGLSGGWTTLYGSGFNKVSDFVVILANSTTGDNTTLCQNAAVVSSTTAMCLVPPTLNPSPRPLVVNGYLQGIKFSICAPIISSISAQAGSSSVNVTVSGQNFGTNPSSISIMFQRKADFRPYACNGVSIVDANTFRCTVNIADYGQYYATLTVAGQNSPSNDISSYTIGECYTKPLISSDMVTALLTKRSLEKNRNKLASLVEDLKTLRINLPDLHDNDCGRGSSFQYPVPHFELQFLSSDSFEFKDCVDAFCSQREQFLSSLVTYNYNLMQSWP